MSLFGMLKCHPPCQEPFPAHGSPYVLCLHWVSACARPKHTLVVYPLLTPACLRITFEIEASLVDWQSSPPRSCQRTSQLPSMGKHSWVWNGTPELRAEEFMFMSMFSTCSLQTILRPESHQKELFLKAYGQDLNLEGIRKEERLCLEISSVREEGN